MTIALHTPTTSRLWQDAPILTGLAIIITLASLPILSAMTLDPRQFLGDPIWVKPLKFHIALAIYLITLAFYARFIQPNHLIHRGWRIYIGVVATCIVAELLWVDGAAALGTASHFNVATPVATALYTLMGLSAVTLTSLAPALGVAILRNPAPGLDPTLRLALALGLVLTFALTVVVAGTMSSLTGHLIGQPLTGAKLPLFGWSREVGDLRAAHFFATHALHAVPLAGLVATRLMSPANARRAVWTTALLYTALIAALFGQALMGLPLI